MRLKRLEIVGFKSFGRKTTFDFDAPITAIVGPNGSGKSNVAEALRWVLGEQSMKSLRGKRGEDLIFNGSGTTQRQNRASVKLVFDNSDNIFKFSAEGAESAGWDEVSIERAVHRDGANEYSINGSQVRLRDVMELLSGVSLGPSGHHIISQGEADRVLNANAKERREILEDALGLKIYQFKIAESEKRLTKTRDNMEQVGALRREIAPHLRYLKKQVEEIEKVVAIKKDLAELACTYFLSEQIYLGNLEKSIKRDKQKTKADLERVERELANAQKSPRIREITEGLNKLRGDKDDISRQVGRLEGKIEGSKRVELVRVDERGEERCRYCGQVIAKKADGSSTSRGPGSPTSGNGDGSDDASHWQKEKLELEARLEVLIAKERDLTKELDSLRESERISYEIRAKEVALRGELEKIILREQQYESEMEVFRRDAHEVSLLVGRNILEADGSHASGSASRDFQHDLRKKLERLKIKVEDAGGVGTDVMKEYEETTARDAHLERELADLNTSEQSLTDLIKDLRGKLEERFHTGLSQVNIEFEKFFVELFSGGHATLEVRTLEARGRIFDEESGELLPTSSDPVSSTPEWGIEVNLSLPRKKIKGLEMLSGGERSLTSIALIFALSQVNPPPFLVLDETDAALDEANSRRYGAILSALSSRSQLLVITHNRETMSHASVLYGVTMGSDSISKLLSIRFDDAVTYAK